jgi:hypothetical protein
MTQDEIIEMAIENTINGLNFNQEGLVRFAKLVAAKEREACAKVCDSFCQSWLEGAEECADAIRARGEQA